MTTGWECVLAHVRNEWSLENQMEWTFLTLPELACTRRTLQQLVRREFAWFSPAVRETVRNLLVAVTSPPATTRRSCAQVWAWVNRGLRSFYDNVAREGLLRTPTMYVEMGYEENMDAECEFFNRDEETIDTHRLFPTQNNWSDYSQLLCPLLRVIVHSCSFAHLVRWPVILYSACSEHNVTAAAALLKSVPMSRFRLDDPNWNDCMGVRRGTYGNEEERQPFALLCARTALDSSSAELCETLCSHSPLLDRCFAQILLPNPHLFPSLPSRIPSAFFRWGATKLMAAAAAAGKGSWTVWDKTHCLFLASLVEKCCLEDVRWFMRDCARLSRNYWIVPCQGCNGTWKNSCYQYASRGQTLARREHGRWLHLLPRGNDHTGHARTKQCIATAILVEEYGILDAIAQDEYAAVRNFLQQGMPKEALSYLQLYESHVASAKRPAPSESPGADAEHWTKRMKL